VTRHGTARFAETYGGFGGFGLCVVGGVGFGLCVAVGVPGRPDRSGQPGEREGAVVQQAADELPPLGGGRRGSGTRGPGPRPLNSHVKGITLKIGSPLPTEQLGEVWAQQLIPKLPALTLLRYPASVQLLSAKEIGQRAQADPRRAKC
jgi:hypothetical protein